MEAWRRQIRKSRRRLYVDKSHPNLGLAERLEEAFPSALFIAIERDPYATVASMLRHASVLKWQRRWREFPVPNRFLGITGGDYHSVPLAAQCAMRWLAYHRRIEELRVRNLLVVCYEAFDDDRRRRRASCRASSACRS